MAGFCHVPLKVHVWSWLGGFMYNTGFLFSLLAAPLAGAAAAWAFGNGSPLVGILWGLFAWKEFKGVQGAGKFLAAVFACYVVGLVLIGLSA
jgi:glucose uptake protein